MNKDLLIIIMCFAIFYLFYEINNFKNQKIEGFTTTNDAAINTAVKKIYLADVEAIRLLSNFAIQLSQGGTTIPGNVNFAGDVSFATKITGNAKVAGRISTNDLDPNDIPGGWGGGLRTWDLYAGGTIGAGGNKAVNASLDSNGFMYAKNGFSLAGSGNLANGIFNGPGDNATAALHNVSINSWWGLGFTDTYSKKTNIWFDLRTGVINCKAINVTG